MNVDGETPSVTTTLWQRQQLCVKMTSSKAVLRETPTPLQRNAHARAHILRHAQPLQRCTPEAHSIDHIDPEVAL